jgi:hypothetical protein
MNRSGTPKRCKQIKPDEQGGASASPEMGATRAILQLLDAIPDQERGPFLNLQNVIRLKLPLSFEAVSALLEKTGTPYNKQSHRNVYYHATSLRGLDCGSKQHVKESGPPAFAIRQYKRLMHIASPRRATNRASTPRKAPSICRTKCEFRVSRTTRFPHFIQATWYVRFSHADDTSNITHIAHAPRH